MAYDPETEAIMRAALQALDPQPGDDALAYEEILRRLQRVLMDMLALGAPEPSPEQDSAVRQAVSQLVPVADDQYAAFGTLLRRFQATVDVELSRWTSAMVQPIAPSGYTAVPEVPPAPVP
jgi:hypothetical protein